MEHAWLDSLSEDWVSQAGSEASPPPPAAAQVAAKTGKSSTKVSSKPRTTASRLPRLHGSSLSADSSRVLSERSINDINIPSPSRGPSKLSQEIKTSGRGRHVRRSVSVSSVSTTDSVVHNTVNHNKSFSASPAKNKGSTPEWKRRLVYGNFAYGEQRDLFSSAGVGLENIFKPPVSAPGVITEEDEGDSANSADTAAMRSSPPTHRFKDGWDSRVDTGGAISEEVSTNGEEVYGAEGEEEDTSAEAVRPKPRMMRFRMTDEQSADVSANSSLGAQSDSQGPSTTERSQENSRSSEPSPLEGRPNNRESRLVSGQSVLRNEDFSPIEISPGKPEDGTAAVPQLEVQPAELKKRLEKLRLNQMMLANEISITLGDRSASATAAPLNMDSTGEYEKMGGFINFRRGGRSQDGSFRHRPLSPPLNTDTSEMLPEESLQASTPKQFPSVRVNEPVDYDESPPLLRVPNPSPDKRAATTFASSTGSPLKLFGPYDTFTNQTLMRRISQFEDQISDRSRTSGVQSAAERDFEEEPSQSRTQEFSIANSSRLPSEQDNSRLPSAQFGAGELDGYEFNDLSCLSQEGWQQPSQSEQCDGRGPSPAQGSAESSFAFDNSVSSSASAPPELFVLRRREKSFTASAASKAGVKFRMASMGSVKDFETVATPRRRDAFLEGKRPRTSPSKDPTPKRRRTLHRTDIAYGIEETHATIETVQSSHQQMQTIIGRKRRDARDGDMQQPANPSVLANRLILRPRTPTPTQRSSTQREQHPDLEDDYYSDMAKPPVPQSFGPRVLPPRPATSGVDGERKPSIRTEDFMNEAHKIMAMLRSRGGRQSGLASVEESESENVAAPQEDADGSFQESTKEPFSRPPSREGPPLPRGPARQEDPEVLARLKKYEERSDMDGLISSSTRSISLAQDAIRAAKQVEEQVHGAINKNRGRAEIADDGIVSDPPNMRISMNPTRHQTGPLNGSGGASASQDGLATQASTASGDSVRSSIPTGSSRELSSRGSDSRKTIALETVSHLIPDQVGNMVFDRERNIWVKRKGSSASEETRHVLPSEGSEEDPFADIPDLTVDVTMELQNVKMRAMMQRAWESVSGAEAAEVTENAPNTPDEPSVSDPRMSPHIRDDSGGEEEPLPESPSELLDTMVDHPEEAVEREISIDEDRVSPAATPKKRNLTITFSSPIASIIQDVVEEQVGAQQPQPDASTVEASLEDVSVASVGRGRRKVSVKIKCGRRGTSRSRSTSRGSTKPFSVAGHAFVPRPVSRIDERDEEVVDHDQQAPHQNTELSLVGDRSGVAHVAAESNPSANQRRASLSFLVTTPGHAKPAPQRDAGRLMAQYVGTLSLSPMSDFTAHQERSVAFEASYVLGDQHLVTGDGSKPVMSQTLRDLVDRLSEVEPFEPYWEEMEELDLHEKRLSSLHKLDEFCHGLITLDASGNSLRNLSGIPHSVRHLKIVENHLSELTSWAHLMNLQYLDISNNDVKTLSGLKNLVHLRSLRADNCNLTQLDGFKYHDAIQVLRARGNKIEAIDFDGARLEKLVELDLEGNEIKAVSNIDQLGSLVTLNLRRNKLEDFPLEAGKPLALLRTLNLSDNSLTTLDVSRLPSLRLLHADRNHLVRVRGFSKTPRLDSISLREQMAPERLDLSSLYHAYEIRKLYLSGNLLENFDPPVDFLNLQLLELANCGLTSLPEEFGRMMPNLRKLNLNFNALSDLSCLRGIPRLKRILAAGNRLAHAYSVVEVLADFPHLAEVDLRDNSITQGFYPPPHILVSSKASLPPEPFTLPPADAARDRAYSSRLDLETGMRRRVYEQVFVDTCLKLKMLDGLTLNRDIGQVRDAVWEALAARGILVTAEEGEASAVQPQKPPKETSESKAESKPESKTESKAESKEESREESRDESRWGAEDTFA